MRPSAKCVAASSEIQNHVGTHDAMMGNKNEVIFPSWSSSSQPNARFLTCSVQKTSINHVMHRHC